MSDVMGQARSDPAGVASKFANENGYASDKLRLLFGDQPVSGLLEELDKQGQIRATNNLALGGSKTAMATTADNLIPTANKVGAVGHGGGTALSVLAGHELGDTLGDIIGMPHAGGLAGVGGGLLWNGSRPRSSTQAVRRLKTPRAALARALTEPPTSALADALSRRAGTAGVGAASSTATKALTRALMASAPQEIDPAAKRAALAQALLGYGGPQAQGAGR
jgi:hypothetical protein